MTLEFEIEAAVVFLVYIGIIGLITWASYRRSRATAEDYFLMGRTMGWFVGSLALMSNLLSGFTFFGLAGIATFGAGALGWFLVGEASLGTIVALIAPRLWRLSGLYGYVTPTDYIADRFEFNDRYGAFLRQFLAWTYISIGLIPSAVVQVQAMGIAGESLLGIPYFWSAILLGTVALLYTMIGGMRGTVWVGAFEGGLMLLMMWVGGIWVASKAGGLPAVWHSLITSDPGYVAANQGYYNAGMWFSIFPFFIWASAVKPGQIQAIYAARDEKQLARLSWLFPLLVVLMIIPPTLMVGPAAKVLLPEISNPDWVFPTLIVKFLPFWFFAPVLSAALAAVMSTVDTEVLAASMLFTQDVYVRTRKGVPERQKLTVARLIMVAVMAIAFFFAAYKPTLIFELEALLGLVLLQTVPAIVGGLYWRRLTKEAALVGIVVGVPLATFVSLRYGCSTPVGPLHLLPGVYVFLLTCVLTAVVTYLTPPPKPETQRKFFDLFEEPAKVRAARELSPAD